MLGIFRMRRLLFTLVFISVSWHVQAQEWNEEVNGIFDDFKMLGMSAGYFNSTDWLLKGEFGVRMSGDETPIGPDDKFSMGIASRTLTGVLFARMLDAGVVNWTTTVKEALMDPGLIPFSATHEEDSLYEILMYKAKLPTMNVFNYESHLMDVADELFLESTWGENNTNVEKRLGVASILFNYEWEADAEDGQIETDLSYSMATAMLEAVTGDQFETLLDLEVFTPLNITGCHVGPPTLDPSIPPVQPWDHLAGPWGVYNLPLTPGNTAGQASWQAPDTGISCDAESVRILMSAIMDSENDFLSQEMKDLILKGEDEDCEFCSTFGGWLTYLNDGGPPRSTIAFTFGLGTSTFYMNMQPDSEEGLTVLYNTNLVDGMRQNIGLTAVYGSICKRESCPAPEGFKRNIF